MGRVSGMSGYRLAADGVLVLHASFVAFVVFGLPLIWIGAGLGWTWVRSWWFRIMHLSAIGLVVLQSWLSIVCPLTDLENHFRVKGGQTAYDAAGCIQYWLHRMIFFTAPAWVFITLYTLFAVAVLVTLIVLPPRRPKWLARDRQTAPAPARRTPDTRPP